MAGIRKVRKEATRAKVLAAARTCFDTLGYERAVLRDIANTAGVSTGSVFSNFTDKADLYRAVYGHAPVSAEMGAGLLSVIRAALASGETLYGVDVERARALVAQVEEA
jgi:AcrR family transcriptional regulator